jgi:hypothetical protein
MNIEYNIKTEVTKNQFTNLRKYCSGICAFRQENEKYFVKLLLPKYKNN